MHHKKKILAISGSTRANSTNENILKIIANVYQDILDIELYKDIAILPHFNPDLDNEQVPTSVKNFRGLIKEADGVLICTPEYVFSLPGTLKNAIEWTVSTTVFSHKSVALLVASSLGEKAYESLILIMKTIEAKIGENATLLLQGAKSKLNEQNQITDEDTLQALEQFMQAFINSID